MTIRMKNYALKARKSDMSKTHRIARIFRDLRLERFGSLTQFEKATGLKGVTAGSYERGDRHCTLERADEILSHYGLELTITEIDSQE